MAAKSEAWNEESREKDGLKKGPGKGHGASGSSTKSAPVKKRAAAKASKSKKSA